jgi:prolipoprotein diacylglyceryltransferase
MALLTWLSDHALILLLGCGTLFNVYWLHRCRERLHLRWLSVLLLSVLHTVLGVLSVKVFALFETGNFSNMSLFGGVFFMPLFYWGVAKLAKQKTADVFDVFTICLVFTLMCARLNCIISGCCLGAHIPIEGLTHLRFPTRELELLFYVLLLSRLWRKVLSGSARGMIYPIYMISYGIFRFVTETLRVSDRTDSILHVSHLWALLSLGIGISIYGELRKKEKKTGGRRNG